MDNSICHNGSKVAPKVKKHHFSRLSHSLTLFAKIKLCDYCVTSTLDRILKDHNVTSNHEIEEAIAPAENGLFLMTCEASSVSGWAVLHGSLRLAESILLNRLEIFSAWFVNVEIGGRPRTFSPAADQHFAPIGRCLEKKMLSLFPFANISLKYNLNAVEMGYFLLSDIIFSQKMKTDGSLCGEKGYRRPRITLGRTATISIMFCFWW
jgi:hypothetical protein